jgi:hypothetical protein
VKNQMATTARKISGPISPSSALINAGMKPPPPRPSGRRVHQDHTPP